MIKTKKSISIFSWFLKCRYQKDGKSKSRAKEINIVIRFRRPNCILMVKWKMQSEVLRKCIRYIRRWVAAINPGIRQSWETLLCKTFRHWLTPTCNYKIFLKNIAMYANTMKRNRSVKPNFVLSMKNLGNLSCKFCLNK